MSYFVDMSPLELQFIRVYVAAMRRNYAELRSVVDLMNPAGLGVQDFYTATVAANRLNDMQHDFDVQMQAVQRKHKLRTKPVKPVPADEDLVDLFELSFFKLVTKVAPDVQPPAIVLSQNGWFSGKPTEWKNSLKSYQGVPKDKDTKKDLPDILSAYLKAFAKFFYTNDWPKDFPPGPTKKIWPIAGPNDHLYENEPHDEDDDNENPFNWLFEDDD